LSLQLKHSSTPSVQGCAQVPLLSPTLPAGQHMLLEQLPLQHWLAVASVQGSPSGMHAGVKQLAHLPPQSQGCFFRWRRRSRLLTQRVTALAKSHSSVSRSKGTWQMRTHSSSSASTREGISAAMALPAMSLSARRRLREPSARARARSSKYRLVVCWLTCAPIPRKGGTLGEWPRPVVQRR
jgi:hypothetical protein